MRSSRRLALLLAASAAARSSLSAPTGSLELIYYTSRAGPAELGSLSLATGKLARLATRGAYGSRFGDNVDYDNAADLLLTSTEALDDPSPVTDGRLITFAGATKKVAVVNSTFCWGLHAAALDKDVLCLTEWPFYNFSAAGAAPSSRRAAARGAAADRELLALARSSGTPLPLLARQRAADQRRRRGAAPEQQEQFLLRLDVASGRSTLVRRNWSDNDVPQNNCETLDRSGPKPVLYAWMSDVVNMQSLIYGVDATTGAVLSKVTTPVDTLFYTWEFCRADNKTYGVVAEFVPAKKAWSNTFAALDLQSGSHTTIAAVPEFDSEWGPTFVSTISDDTFFTCVTDKAGQFLVVGLAIATGKVSFGPVAVNSSYTPGQFVYKP